MLKSSNPIHILIVDDEQHLRQFLYTSLQEAGYVVHTAPDGAKALDIFHKIHIDLVLLDLQLPNRDGYSVCAELRRYSLVPIIIMSSYCAPEDIVLSYSQGADEHISKPFQLRDIETRIERLLHRSRQFVGAH